MPAGPVYLMAGAGPGTGPRSVHYHQDAIAATGKAKPTIAYIGCAAGDSYAFEKMLGAMILVSPPTSFRSSSPRRR